MKKLVLLFLVSMVGCSLLPSGSEKIQSQPIVNRAEFTALSNDSDIQVWMQTNIAFQESISTEYRNVNSVVDSGYSNNLEMCLLYLNIKYIVDGSEGYLLVWKNIDYNYPKTSQYTVTFDSSVYSEHSFTAYTFSELFY